MQRVYQGLLGSYKTEDEKHQATHMALTMEEFNDLQVKVSRLEREVQDANFKRDVAIRRCDSQIKELNYDHAKEIKKIKADAEEFRDKAMAKVQEYERLNENLKRICRENANAKRGIQPKKKCSGFVVIATAEVFERLKDKKGYTEHRAYRSIIETPYDARLELTDTLKAGAWNEGLGKFFDTAWKDADENNYLDAIKDDAADKNFVYRQNWRTNKNGFWEIECFHTKPINL